MPVINDEENKFKINTSGYDEGLWNIEEDGRVIMTGYLTQVIPVAKRLNQIDKENRIYLDILRKILIETKYELNSHTTNLSIRVEVNNEMFEKMDRLIREKMYF